MWKAKSQAANQGYSHLSGIETRRGRRRASTRGCGHRAVRTAAVERPIAVEPVLDNVVVELLGPEQAGVGLSRDGRRCLGVRTDTGS